MKFLALRHNTLHLLAALLCPSLAFATTVYRTVDEYGAIHFSDTPPSGLLPVDTLQINTSEPLQPEATGERLRQLRETTDRMAADRRARERHRAEMRKLRSETDLNRAALDATNTEETRYHYEPYGYPVYAPLRRHRPGIAHPAPLPVSPVVQPSPPSSGPFSRIRRGYSPQVRDFFNR